MILATHPSDIFHRLEASYHTAIITVDAQLDLPPERKDEFEKIRGELQATYLNPARRTFSTHSERQRWASTLAARLLDFYDALIKTK